MTPSNNNSNSIDESKLGQSYMGRTKLICKDGQRIVVPDLEAYSNRFVPTPITNNNNYTTIKELKYEKTLDQVLSSTDKFQFDRLKTDEQRYAMIKNMIIGLEQYPLFNSEIGSYVERDFRSLDQILRDLIKEHKVFLNPEDGNLYSFQYAIDHKMIEYPILAWIAAASSAMSLRYCFLLKMYVYLFENKLN
jgi:hypothetical protein